MRKKCRLPLYYGRWYRQLPLVFKWFRLYCKPYIRSIILSTSCISLGHHTLCSYDTQPTYATEVTLWFYVLYKYLLQGKHVFIIFSERPF
jgi:hypothetical protein